MAGRPQIIIVIRAVVRGNFRVSGFVRLVEIVSHNRSTATFNHAVRHKGDTTTYHNGALSVKGLH